ncbi:YncE family protein [Anaeromyxobacter sp. Red801]|uniref:YncE family protein n=1 Tax=Anaeromyxobacter sp. Red801 TaxID=3411632 RepID=UPI003B9FFB83
MLTKGSRAAAAALALACAPAPEAPGARHHLYVSQAASGSVAVVDPERGESVRRIPVGQLPHQLLPVGDRLLVVLTGSQAVAELDPAAARVTRTFLTAPLPPARADGTPIAGHATAEAAAATSCAVCHGAPGGPAPRYVGERPIAMLALPGGRLLVAHVRSGALTELDLASGAIRRRVALEPAGEAREAVALAQLGGEVLVALRPKPPSSAPAVIRRLDAVTLAPLGDVAVGPDPVALLAVPERGLALVSDFASDTVTPVAAGAGAGPAFTAAPGPMGLLPLPGGRRVLALDYYSDSLSRLDLDTGEVRTERLRSAARPYANPSHAALSPDGRVAWVVSSGTEGHVLAVDVETLAVARALPVDGLSFAVAVVPGPAPLPPAP